MITVEQEKFNLDIIKRKLDLLTRPIAYFKKDHPYPNPFYKRDVVNLVEYIDQDPTIAMKTIYIVYSNNYGRWKVVFNQWQRDLMENITEEEIRYMYDMRGNMEKGVNN